MTSREVKAVYEARIAALKEAHSKEVELLSAQIELMRAFALPPTPGFGHIPVLQAESDAILTPGVNESIEMTPAQIKEWEDTQSEADKLFAGTY